MAITSFATLKTEIADWLNRSDLTAVIPSFIGAAEEQLKNDPRLRKLKSAAFSITSDDIAVPTDFLSLDSWYHDSSPYFGPIEIVGADALPGIKQQFGTSGVPSHAAIIDGKFRFAPAPSGTFSTKMVYWRSLGSAEAGTSWLFTENPYLYMYAALVAAAPYLKDDSRVMVWKQEVADRIAAIDIKTEREHFGGTMRRQFRPIG